MRNITVGFEFSFCCFPLRERNNWMLGWHGSKSLCIGPMRFSVRKIQVPRNWNYIP